MAEIDAVSPSEAAQILECSTENVRRLVSIGKLSPLAVTRAGQIFARRDVEQLAAERKRKKGKV
jgi:predicted site-specific integrase-resolvase